MSEKTILTDVYVEKKFKEYFKSKLSSYVEGEDSWHINWNPAKAFVRPDDLYWLDFYFLPNVPNQMELGTWGRNRWTGVVQINVCVPLDTSAEDEEDIEDNSAMDTCFLDISRVFRRGVIFNGIRINKCYRNTSALQTYEDFCCLPVTIEWVADLSN